MHKNQVFLTEKRLEKICNSDNWPENKSLQGQKTSKNNAPVLHKMANANES